MTRAQESCARETASEHMTMRRRGLIAGAAALVAGIAARDAAQRVGATDGNPLIVGVSNSGTTETDLVFTGGGANAVAFSVDATGASSGGYGINGSGGGIYAGVVGHGGAQGGGGVIGLGGGQFNSTPIGAGVQGYASGIALHTINPNNFSALACGVYGSGQGRAVPGILGVSDGTAIQATSSAGRGVDVQAATDGVHVITTGSFSSGVYAQNNGTTGGIGLFGACDTPASGIGVIGRANNGTGVKGQSNAGIGVLGSIDPASTAANAIAVSGVNSSPGANGIGVSGQCDVATGVGVKGASAHGIGVRGSTGGTGEVAGVYGISATAYGIIGNTTASGYSGLTAITGTAGVAALAATATVNTAYAAYFQGTTIVQGDFAVVGGSKSAAVPHPDGSHRLVYCVESPESWFEDFGKAKLVGGKAEVKLDADFAAIVHADDYHVFLTPYGESAGLHVANQSPGGFTVQEAKGGASSLTFSWRAVAKRKDIAGARLAKFAPPKINHPDPAKLPK